MSGRAAKNGLSPEKILSVAVAIADREGLGGVTMRRLAREHSVTPMALYWHFEDKDRLLDAMVEQVFGEARFTDVPGGAWEDRFREVLVRLVDLLHDHPWLGRPVIERLVPLPKHLTALEILLDSARQAGLGPYEGSLVVQQGVQAAVALADYEPKPRAKATPPTPERAARLEFLTTLPPEEFPNIRAAADHLTTPPDLEDYYRLGIDMIVGGIAAIASSDAGTAASTPSSSRRRASRQSPAR